MNNAAIDYAALAGFRSEIRRFLAFSEIRARAEGLTAVQHQLMLALKALPDPTIGDLAEWLIVKHHTAVELVDRLEKRRLLRRRRDETDRRRIRLELTPKGERVLRRLSLAHLHEIRTTGPALVMTLTALTSRARRKNRP